MKLPSTCIVKKACTLSYLLILGDCLKDRVISLELAKSGVVGSSFDTSGTSYLKI
jgi:hypothetical protein